MEFEYTVKNENGVQIIALSGNLMDKNQANELIEEIDGMILNGNRNFIINLEHFQYMNSSGLNVLIHMLTKARKNGGEAIICSMSEKIKQLLVITKLISVFTITDNANAALELFSKN